MTPNQARATELMEQVGSKAEVARLMGVNESTVRGLLLRAQREQNQEDLEVVPTRVEQRDASFWKTKALLLEKENDELLHLSKELRGVVNQEINAPSWLTRDKSNSHRSVIIAHTSDVHMGEVVRATEVGGAGAYNPTIAKDRMKRYFETVCTIPFRWLHESPCDGIILTMGGDLTSGDIHEELSATNALTSHQQLVQVVEVYVAGIKQLLSHYERVHLIGVPGNHGRTTHKSRAKQYGALSYDTLAASMVRAAFLGDDRVSSQIAEGSDVWTEVYGRGLVTTHGDKMGTGGGMGFAGPILPIVRGGAKVRNQYQALGKSCDLILSGHYHFSAAPPGMLANGSVVGTSEYGYGLRFAPDEAKQWVARYSEAWGLCERLEVRLQGHELVENDTVVFTS